MSWFLFCLIFTLTITLLTGLPVMRHPSLPRKKKIVLALILFLLLVPVDLWLYGWVGMPLMAVL